MGRFTDTNTELLESIEQYQKYIAAIMKVGVKTAVIVKMGTRGVLLAYRCNNGDELRFQHYPALKAKVVNVLGAGDCLVAGVVSNLHMRLC